MSSGGVQIDITANAPPNVPQYIEFGATGDMCFQSVGSTSGAMTVTSDRHGFDGVIGAQRVPLHVRVDALGVMHVELDTVGAVAVSPTDTIEGTCDRNFVFTATKTP